MIQIDMAMPDNCVECRFNVSEFGFCNAMPVNFCGRVNDCEEDGRPEWCPLVAQQPRLLTIDEIHDSMVVWLEAGTKLLKIVDDDGVVLAIGGSERAGAKCFITVWDVCVAMMNDEYNLTWRAWSGRPTKEQQEKELWNRRANDDERWPDFKGGGD